MELKKILNSACAAGAFLALASGRAPVLPEGYNWFTGRILKTTSPWAISLRPTSGSGNGEPRKESGSSSTLPRASTSTRSVLPQHRLLGGIEVKDFILEAKLRQTGKEYGHRDMCVFGGFRDRSHFYYTHIASVTDNHAHNCFIVNGRPRTKISHETTKGHKWSSREGMISLGEEFGTGKIEVLNDLEKPIMKAKDKTFEWGRIGFGSFDDTGRIAEVRLYAPDSRKSEGKDPFAREQ